MSPNLKTCLTNKWFKTLFFILIFYPFSGITQSNIAGTIKNTEGEKIIFASIYLNQQKFFTHSSNDGSFKLEIDNKSFFNDTLTIKFIGYTSLNIPIYYQGENIMLENLTLIPESNILSEVSILAPPPVEKIMKLALKRIKKNYISTSVQQEGFYREVGYENDNCILVNEAVINLDYSKYSSGINMGQRFRDYYKNQTINQNDFGNVFRYEQYFPFYTSRDDKVYIPYSRKTYNSSKYKNNPSPYGGPNDLLAMDKVKFLYDFMDPQMFSKYGYKNLGKENINGTICYKIGFTPIIESEKKKKSKVWHPISKKMKYPIYAGFIYVGIKDYAVLGFEGQKYILADFSIYETDLYRPEKSLFSYPNFLSFKVTYRKNKDKKYVLATVETEKIRNLKFNNQLIRYTSKRLLNLYDSDDKIESKEEDQFFYGNNTSLRNFVNEYDESFWKKYEESPHFVPLTKQEILDLEIKNSLKNQFLDQNKMISDFEKPNFEQIYQLFRNQNDSNQYFTSLKAKYDTLLINYILTENQYYNAVLEKLKRKKRYYLYSYFHLLKDQKPSNEPAYFVQDGEKIYSKKDSNNHYLWYSFDSNEKIVDFTQISKGKENYSIEGLKLSHSNQIALSYSERGNISEKLMVFHYGADSAHFETDGVMQFYWLTDSSLIYTKTDATERPYLIVETNVYTQKTDTLFTLKNEALELNLFHNESGTLLKVENNDGTGYFSLNRTSHQFEDRIEIKEGTNFEVANFDSENVIVLEEAKMNLIRFGNVTDKEYGNLPIIYKTASSIEEIEHTKDYIVFTERLSGNYQLKVYDVTTQKTKRIDCIPEYASIALDDVSVNENQVTISIESALRPYCQLKLNIDTKELDTIYTEHVSDAFDLSKFAFEYVEIQVEDDVKVPVTILYKKEFEDSLKGLLIKTYGTYSSIYFPSFDVDQLIYANAGMGVAFVHPRGSGEKGYEWYTEGKKLNKKNTFTDYIGCVEHLKRRFKLERNQIIGYGTSAGGLTMGVVANLRPDLFGGLVFDKPYLNVLDVMTNPNLPLTILEYSEFGNINEEEVYDYVKSYAPLDNIKEQVYPNILMFNKYHDMNTPYWNTVKGVTNYRKYNRGNSLILMSTDLQAGHRGNVNYLINLDYQSDMFAFVLYTIGN